MSVDLPVTDVVAMFAPYIKFFVAFADQVPRPPAVTGFDVMLTQRSLCIPTVPRRIPSRSKKDGLYNAVVGLLEQDIKIHQMILTENAF